MNLLTYFQQEWLHNLFGALIMLLVVWTICVYRNHRAEQRNAGIRVYPASVKNKLTELGKRAFRSGSLNGGKVYRHKGNKKEYTIIFVTNWISDKPSFPIMVTYSDNFSNLYTRAIHEFMDRFELVGNIHNDIPSASDEIMARVHNMTKREGDNGVFLVTPYSGEIWESLECVIATEFTKKRVVIEAIANKGTAQPIVIFYDEDRKNILAMNQYNFIHKYNKQLVRGTQEIFLGSVNREALESSGILMGNFVEVTQIITTNTGDTVTVYDGMRSATLSGLQGLSVGETYAVCSGYGLILSPHVQKENSDQESDLTLEVVSEEARNLLEFINERQWDLNTLIFTVDKILEGRRAVFSYLAPIGFNCDMATLPIALYYDNLKLGEKYKFTGSRFERVSFSSVQKPDITESGERALREFIKQDKLILTKGSAHALCKIFAQDGVYSEITQLRFLTKESSRAYQFQLDVRSSNGTISRVQTVNLFFANDPDIAEGSSFFFDGTRLYLPKEEQEKECDAPEISPIILDDVATTVLKIRGVVTNDLLTAGKSVGNRVTLLRDVMRSDGTSAGVHSIFINTDHAEEFSEGRKFIFRNSGLYPVGDSPSSYISKISLLAALEVSLHNATYGSVLELRHMDPDGTITFLTHTKLPATVKVDVALMPTELFCVGSKYIYEVHTLVLIEE